MIIIVDTNVVYGSWAFRSPESIAFLDFIKKTKATVLIPQIVWMEIKKNYKEALLSKANDYKLSCQHFSSVLLEKPEFLHIDFDVDNEVEKYMVWLDKLLCLAGGENVIAYSDDIISRVTDRALYRRRPFNKENQREFKDSLVWESVISVLSSKNVKENKEVAFISNDINAFASNSKDTSLHSELKTEVDAVLPQSFAQELYYYTGLQPFLSAHNSPIESITLESISEYLTSDSSGFIQLYSSVFNNSINVLAQLIRESQSNAYFPNLEDELSRANYISTSNEGTFFVYPFEKAGEFTVFCKKAVKSSVTISYAPSTRPASVESVLREINAEVSLTIFYKNNEFGRIGIESISLLEMEPVPFDNKDKISDLQNRIPFIVSSQALMKAMAALKAEYPNPNTRIVEILEGYLFKQGDERIKFSLDDTLELKPLAFKKKNTNYTQPKRKKKKKGRSN